MLKLASHVVQIYTHARFPYMCKNSNTYKLGVHDMQQALRKAEPGDYKHAVNNM